MLFPRSIRWRLLVWYGLLLVTVLCGFGFTAWHFEKGRRFRRMDDGLQGRLSVLINAFRVVPERTDKKRNPELRLTSEQTALFGGVDGYYYLVWMQGSQPIIASAGAPQNVPVPSAHENNPRMRGGVRESFLFAAPVNCVLVGHSTANEESDLQAFGGALIGIGLAIVAAGLFGGWWLLTQALVPVEKIAAAAEKIATGDLSQRIGLPETESELGRLAAVLNGSFARLEALFVQQARFTADAAHELRTPVAIMLTQTQSALTRERSPAEYRETLEACQRATQRMRRLIESLLQLARLDAGQDALCCTSCDLAKIAFECLELLNPLAEARGIHFNTQLPPLPCEGDPERLAQVVMNLVANAIDYNRDNGEVCISTNRRQDMAILVVRDTGVGIAAEDLPHVFERFHRCDPSRTAGTHSGLGLAIACAIVRAHGGAIEVTSKLGEGTTFTVSLPDSRLVTCKPA